jgi:REP element-mobilizing transposase RayT
MANTYTALNYHVIFSTKNREPWIKQEFEQRIWEYLGGIARNNGMTALCIGGVEDHVHILLRIPPVLAVSKAMQLLKGGSSHWIHDTFPELSSFGWQDGYGAFTVSQSAMEDTKRYIQRQREHHQSRTFKDEYLAFLRKYEVEYDERYLWD